MVVVKFFKSACLNRAMTTSSLVGDFKSHEDQRMIADTEMNYASFRYFFWRTSYTEVNQRTRSGCNSSRFRDQLTQSIYIKYAR